MRDLRYKKLTEEMKPLMLNYDKKKNKCICLAVKKVLMKVVDKSA